MLKATSSPTDRLAFDDQLGAEIEDAGGDDLADELHHLARGVAEAQDPEARGHIAGELFFPAALHLRLDRHGLERLDPGHALDQEGLVLGAALEFLVQPPPEQRRRRRRDRDVERERAEHDPGQQRRVEEHHRQEHEGEEQVDDEGQGRAGEEIADVLQFAHPRHRIADAPRLEVGHRQSQQVVEQARAELDVDAVGGVREQIGPQDAQNGLEHRDRHQTDDQHVERAQGPVHQHLVDDHLEEQRRDQGEQLQEERRDQHLAQEMAIFVDRSQKPGDVEPAGDVRQSGPAGHQDQPAVPDREKLGPRHQGGPGRQRRLDQDLVLGGLGDHQEPAIAQGRDGGQGRLGKPRPVGPVGACLEPEILGAPEHLRYADLVRSQPMPDLSAISRNTLEMQQRHEGFEPRIGWSRAVGCSAHLRSPGRSSRQACGCVSNGCWLDG